MNYKKIYNQLIERGKTRILEGYKEKHHIRPKCIGGTNTKNNLVELTAREHFIAHWLLTLIYPGNEKLLNAFWFMCNGANKAKGYKVSSRVYEFYKIEIQKIKSGKPKSKESIRKRTLTRLKKGNYKRSKESVIKGIETRRAKGSYNYGSFSEEHRKKLSEAKIGSSGPRKPILDTRTNIIYPSQTIASTKLNVSMTTIYRGLKEGWLLRVKNE